MLTSCGNKTNIIIDTEISSSPATDTNITTTLCDIVLCSSNQIVLLIFGIILSYDIKILVKLN